MRIDYGKVAPDGLQALRALGKYTHDSGLDSTLLEFVYMRVSQINGCVFCLDMHAKILRKDQVDVDKLLQLPVWWESPLFSAREKAALAWAEAVTEVADSRVPDEVYERARGQFSEKELVDLTLAIVTINAHNRLAIAFRREPGQ